MLKSQTKAYTSYLRVILLQTLLIIGDNYENIGLTLQSVTSRASSFKYPSAVWRHVRLHISNIHQQYDVTCVIIFPISMRSMTSRASSYFQYPSAVWRHVRHHISNIHQQYYVTCVIIFPISISSMTSRAFFSNMHGGRCGATLEPNNKND